jgi:3-methyladenine DNA glycosylase AlkD
MSIAPLLADLEADLGRLADPAQAPAMAAYMKDHFAFFGIKAPVRKALFKTYKARFRALSWEEVKDLVEALWQYDERECQYIALDLLELFPKAYQPDDVHLLESLITRKSWWDSVDLLAGHQFSHFIRRHPEVGREAVARWRQSPDIWLRRTCLLHQLSWKQQTDWLLLQSLILENAASKEFFLQKAIGWALREYAKTNPDAVQAFVAGHVLKPLSVREALKGIGK